MIYVWTIGIALAVFLGLLAVVATLANGQRHRGRRDVLGEMFKGKEGHR